MEAKKKSRQKLFRFSELKKNLYECSSYTEKIKTFAVHMVGCQLVKAIDVLNSGPECERENPVWKDVPADIFSWSYNHWLKRRQITDVMWLTLMQNRVSQTCLEERKRTTDLNELRNLLHLTLQRYYNRTLDNLDDADNELGSVEKFRGVEVSVTRESTRRSVDYFREVYRNFAFNFLHRCMVIIRPTLSDRYTESDLIHPIERRYFLRFQANTEIQEILMAEQGQVKLEEEIRYYLKRTNKEDKCTYLVMGSYQVELQSLRLNMEKWNERYETDAETLDNAIGYKKSNLDKMRTHKRNLESKLNFYREKLAELERKDQEKLERQMREEEERRIAEELRKVEKRKKAKRLSKLKNKNKWKKRM